MMTHEEDFEERAEFDDGEFDDFDANDMDEWQDCGMMYDGQCSKAGSEECDWECGLLRG
jgi:hypothetical protein